MNDPARHHDVIEVIGARENNLKGFSLQIPKRALTVFTGVSGSGKSSLVFGTIAAESQRMINETYSAFLQGFMPSLSRPEVEDLQGLTAAIVVNQERLGANIRSTVGTVTDVYTLLRILFSRIGEPKIGSPQAFSFNVASISGAGAVTFERGGETTKERREFSITGGMCPRCEGRGQINDIDIAQLIDESLSLNAGAITVPGYKAGGWSVKFYAESGFFDPDKPVRDYSEQERHDLLHREPEKVKMSGINMTYQGLVPQLRKSMLAKDRDAMQPHIRAFVDRAVTFVSCPACEGTRLSELARSVRVAGRSIAEVCAMQLSDLAEWLRELHVPAVAPLRASLLETVEHFIDIGLGYLSLDRPAGTLSGGEAQRVKMIRHLGSALTDITYVFDEPTIGLHPHDIDRMNTMLLRLRDKGNTVLVVEHKPETIEIADHVVDLGPRAGEAGGELCFEGTVAGLRGSDTLTGRHLDYRAQVKDGVRSASGAMEIRGARRNNLREVDVDIPTGVLTVITGVAGSGKSTLIEGSLAGREGVTFIDQSGIKGSSRSNPATYTGLLEPIRKAFAKANGVKPALFSANSEGACPTCGGAGVIYTELGVMETVASPCEDCEGRRFRREVLEYTLGDGAGDGDGDGAGAGGRAALNISQVLNLSVDQAVEFFSAGAARLPAATKILTRLADVGLGYLRLGQPLNTLSGGERQRIKLATKMADPGGVYVLDEPTTGLHLADVENLLGLLDRLVDSGTSVVVIEHHQAVMAHADWIIDLGPGAGTEGGRVVFTGTPAQLIAQGQTLTAEHLGRYVAG
ncbi:ATP-binding cassette domain-containing protein [Nesterenkonia aurantiaca]|uniref:UvrABC system protein A n=1 Tax=Nesterenkonia aurantiaca TaxID=1436010 RepID=A0A4R7G7U2_9MICC|nr:excinuclease ABC subunit UvrA [Nesterenkonia aurantiaca]TDS87497.1 excinuclease UvrABC ATPase subunit [Nesterenkonia aurantiaca]